MPVAEYGKTFDAEKAWKEATPGVHKLAAKLKENGGPYFMGKTRKFTLYYFALSHVFCLFLFCGSG